MGEARKALFASQAYPLRCSALPMLVLCPLSAWRKHERQMESEGGIAADTGSAVHRAIQAWHSNGQDETAALHTMSKETAKYPKADLHDAALHFRPYTRDPRNIEAEIVACERAITFTLPPAATDKTQAKIYVTGTMDQVRRGPDGGLYLYDVKTGQKQEGWVQMHVHALQVGGYCRGATEHFGEPVGPGAIIRTRGYRKRGAPKPEEAPPGVFFEFPWTLQECDLLLDAVRRAVASIRAGDITPGPGQHCEFCQEGGLPGCLIPLEVSRVL